jgi:hypothetical protein
MRSKLLLLSSIAALAVGCGASSIGPRDTARTADTKSASSADDSDLASGELETDQPFDEKKSLSPFAHKNVGDFSVHRFSGSFAKKALTLTEEVRAKKGNLIVIDYTLDDGSQKTTLRVTHDIASDRVLRVREVKEGQEIPAKTAAYEAMIEKTIFVPDSNDALLASERGTCLVAGQETDCDKARYRVSVGEQAYELSVNRSVDGVDLSGEVTAKDGKIIYKAELVESGKAAGDEASFASRK